MGHHKRFWVPSGEARQSADAAVELRRLANSRIGAGSSAVPIITVIAIASRSRVMPIVMPYCAMMSAISALGIRAAARGNALSDDRFAVRRKRRTPGISFATAALAMAPRERKKTPGMLRGSIRIPCSRRTLP